MYIIFFDKDQAKLANKRMIGMFKPNKIHMKTGQVIHLQVIQQKLLIDLLNIILVLLMSKRLMEVRIVIPDVLFKAYLFQNHIVYMSLIKCQLK